MGDIQRIAMKRGYETLSIVGRRKPFSDMPCIKVGDFFSFGMHVIITTLFDRQGFGSRFETGRIVSILRKEKPDIVHLHNLHGYYLNLPILFQYLTEEFDGKVFWTFHDCWPMTGHCAYFTAVGCERWQQECGNCPNKKIYPISLFKDNSTNNFIEKRNIFCNLKNLTIIVPSEWMANIVKRSYMGRYPVKVINNGIDVKTFRYTEPTEEFYRDYHIDKDRKMILGVASVWDKRKGLNDFIHLSDIIPNDYQIVLVGLTGGQIKRLPQNITGITRTENSANMAMLYSKAVVFMNPSLEESFSLVTVEALSCGTPVVVLDTSAVKELVSDGAGIVLSKHEPQDYLDAIEKLVSRGLTRTDVSKTAQKYNAEDYGERVLELYEE